MPFHGPVGFKAWSEPTQNKARVRSCLVCYRPPLEGRAPVIPRKGSNASPQVLTALLSSPVSLQTSGGLATVHSFGLKVYIRLICLIKV